MSLYEPILPQLHICFLLLQHCKQIDIANLTTCSKLFRETRKKLFSETFTLKLTCLEDYEKALTGGARRVWLVGKWVKNYSFDFQGREKNLLLFKSNFFMQPVTSFGNLIHFNCSHFDHPVKSFDYLVHFGCFFFNQPVDSFDQLKSFCCSVFNQRVDSFGQLKSFRCNFFNQPVNSFGQLKSFCCNCFNQPVDSFGQLKSFCCNWFNQKIDSFGNLEKFECYHFDQPVQSFGSLQNFYGKYWLRVAFNDEKNRPAVQEIFKNSGRHYLF